MINDKFGLKISRRNVIKAALGSVTAAGTISVFSTRTRAHEPEKTTRLVGPVGFTSFIHPTVVIETPEFRIGAGCLVEAFGTFQGKSVIIGNATNLQDNCRLLNFSSHPLGQGELELGDGTTVAHSPTFIGRVKAGEGCGIGGKTVVQNARIGDASFIGFTAQILGQDPQHPIQIPESTAVLFGARIRSQSDVAHNTIPVPTTALMLISDVEEESLVLARGFNVLYRAAARLIPFSNLANNPRNPGEDFPSVNEAFGKLSVAPPSAFRRGTGVLPARQTSLDDEGGFIRFQPFSPVATLSTPGPDAGGLNSPPSNSPEAGARFIVPRVQSPELISDQAIVLGGCELASGVVVGAGTYINGDIAPAISIDQGTIIGQNCSIHPLAFSSCRVGSQCVIGNRVVIHGPIEIGNNVQVGDETILFGPTVRDGVKIGSGVFVYGPVEVTKDIPDNAIVVSPGNEFLIAPSAPSHIARITLPHSKSMLAQWQQVQEADHCCGCGVSSLVRMSTLC